MPRPTGDGRETASGAFRRGIRFSGGARPSRKTCRCLRRLAKANQGDLGGNEAASPSVFCTIRIDLQEQKGGGTKRLLQKKERGVRKPNKDLRERPIPFPRKTFAGPSCARPAPSGAELRSSALGRTRTHISRTGILRAIHYTTRAYPNDKVYYNRCLEKMQLDLPKTFFFFLTVHWKMKCNKKYVKAIDKRSSPPICVKSRSQSREHRLPEMERLCARFFLREFLDFI